jgi:hypothetical protein
MEYEFRNVPESVGYITAFPLEKIQEEIGEENFSKMNLEFWIHTSVQNAELNVVDYLDLTSLLLRNMIDSPLEGGFIGDNCWHTLKETGSILFVRNNIMVFLSPQPLNKPDDMKIMEHSARIIDSLLVQSAKVQKSSEIPAPIETDFEIMSELPERFDDYETVEAKIEAEDPNQRRIYIRVFAYGYAIVQEPGETFSLILTKNNITEDSTGVKAMIWIWNEDRYFTLVTHKIPFLTTSSAWYRNGDGEGNSEFLQQNIPNPFTDKTTIECFIPQNVNDARLLVFNTQSALVKSYAIRDRNETTVDIADSELNAGIYIYSLIIDNKVVDSKRMIRTKR